MPIRRPPLTWPLAVAISVTGVAVGVTCGSTGAGLTAAGAAGLTSLAATAATHGQDPSSPSAPVDGPSSSHPAAPSGPVEVTAWVRVAAANVWESPRLVRPVDRLSRGPTPSLRRWVRAQTYPQRLALGTRLMTQALHGEQVVVFGRSGPWDHVRVIGQRGGYYRSGILGWVDAAQLTTSPVPATPAPGPSLPRRGAALVSAARSFLGAPYIFGGLTRDGIDCSGLTYLAALRFGIVLPRDAADQALAGQPVARRRLRPGDLVFFGRGDRLAIHHVGIYIGDGRILHAPHTGSTVRISPLTSLPDYWGARRLLPAG